MAAADAKALLQELAKNIAEENSPEIIEVADKCKTNFVCFVCLQVQNTDGLLAVLALDKNDKEAFKCKIVAMINESLFAEAVDVIQSNGALRYHKY